MGFSDYILLLVLFFVAMLAASCMREENQVVCLEIYEPVCAGGEIYSNECYAMKAGFDNNELTKPDCILNTAGCKCE
tara:strand:- start:12 stop:242 length:231 start_codon:yes stop_codon:yes gene_type:complete